MENLEMLTNEELVLIQGGGDDKGWELLGAAIGLSLYANPVTGPYMITRKIAQLLN